MDYKEFKKGIERFSLMELSIMKRAFLYVLFFTGCRVSEAIALTDQDITHSEEMIYIQFYRLKGSKQTDPQEIPNVNSLSWICEQEGRIFPFSRFTGYRIVKKVFSHLYPHFFRMSRISKISDEFSDATVYHLFGITASSIDHYRAKVDNKRVGESLRKETE
jgi:integrase